MAEHSCNNYKIPPLPPDIGCTYYEGHITTSVKVNMNTMEAFDEYDNLLGIAEIKEGPLIIIKPIEN